MLYLLGVLLASAGLCLLSPVPLPTQTACPTIGLLKETKQALQNLSSKGSSRVMPLNLVEAGGNATTHLEGFIETLKTSKGSEEKDRLILKLQRIQAYGQTCTGWTAALKEHPWNAAKEHDFFYNLEDFLRFLGHNALPEGAMQASNKFQTPVQPARRPEHDISSFMQGY